MPMNAHAAALSVLVPAFNEERTIAQVLRRLLALGPLLKEIVVVDDGSEDRTPDLVREMAACEPLIRVPSIVAEQRKDRRNSLRARDGNRRHHHRPGRRP